MKTSRFDAIVIEAEDDELKKIEGMSLHIIPSGSEEEDKYCPDVVFYKDGPQYWAEILKLKNGNYSIEDFRRIVQE